MVRFSLLSVFVFVVFLKPEREIKPTVICLNYQLLRRITSESVILWSDYPENLHN